MRRYAGLILAGVLLGSGLVYAKVIGRVDGVPITEKDANAFLKVATKGKLKYHQLRPRDKKDVIRRLATDTLLVSKAKKDLSLQERNQVIVNYWLSQKIKNVTVDEAEIEKAYKENKKFFKGKNGEILPYEKVKEMIAVSLKQKKYVAQLMENVKITMGNTVIKAPKNGNKTKNGKGSYKGKTKTYLVKSGNTLSGIAHKYHITIKQLREMNNLSEKSTLKIGQKLKVPAQ